MGPVRQAAGPANLQDLSDKELLTRYCAEEWKRQREKRAAERPAETGELEKKNVEFAEELWRRYEMEVYEYLQRSSRALCPVFHDRGDLVHDSHIQFRKNFINRICGFRNIDSPRSFEVWRERGARSAMLDERRKVTGRPPPKPKKLAPTVTPDEQREAAESRVRRRKRNFVSLEKQITSEEGETSETTLADVIIPEEFERPPVSPPEAGEERSSYVYFRSRCSTNPRDAEAPVERKLVEGQRSSVVAEALKALKRHAESSDDNAHSARLVRWRYWRRWTYARIGARVYGAPATPTQKNTQEQRIKRMLADDYVKLLTILGRTWGITAPEHL